jgi:hypothetical protein
MIDSKLINEHNVECALADDRRYSFATPDADVGTTAGINERAERLLKSIVMGLSTCWRRAHGRSTRFELSLPAREKKKSTQHNAVS